MFLLRGRDKEQMVEALRGRRLGAAPAPATAESTDEADLRGFWSASSAAGEVALKFAVPDSDALPVKQLGPAPFVRDPTALVAALEATYRAISDAALRLALDDE
jgi:hypothetical protein